MTTEYGALQVQVVPLLPGGEEKDSWSCTCSCSYIKDLQQQHNDKRCKFLAARKKKNEKEDNDVVQDFKEKWTDEFDLTGGLRAKAAAHGLCDSNWRPLAFVFVNMLLVIPCMCLRNPFWSLPGIVFNGLILVVGLFSELLSLNVLNMCCGCFGYDWLFYDRSQHYSVFDAWLNIRKFLDSSEIKLLDSTDESQPMASDSEAVLDSMSALTMLEPAHDCVRQLTGDEIAAEYEQSKRQLVPPPFSYRSSVAFFFTNWILFLTNAFFYWDSINSYNYRENHALKTSWIMYCTGDDHNTHSARRNGECLLRFSAWMSLVSVSVWSLFAAAVLRRNVKRKHLIWTRLAKEALLENFPGDLDSGKPSARKLVDDIKDDIESKKRDRKYWEEKLCPVWCKNEKTRVPLLTMISAAVSAIMVLFSFLGNPSYLFQVRRNYVFVYLIFGVSTALCVYSLTAIQLILHRIYAFYLEASDVMEALAKPIDVQCIDDLVIWWETRKFHQNYQNPVLYVYGAMSMTFLVVSTSLVIFWISVNLIFSFERRYLSTPGSALRSCVVFLFICALLRILNVVVSIESAQRLHSDMLRREKVRLDAFSGDYTRQTTEQKVADEQSAGDTQTQTRATPAALAQLGQKSHQLFETMLQIIDNSDKYPDVLGLQVSRQKVWALATYLITAVPIAEFINFEN